MGEQTSGLVGKFETLRLQHIGVREATIVVELGEDLMSEIAKRGRKYQVALAPIWKVRTRGAKVVLGEETFGGRIPGVALMANDDEIAERLARHLREVFEESAVRKAENEGPKDEYNIRLSASDVDLSGVGEVIAEVERERRLNYQRQQWDKIPEPVSEELDGLREIIRGTIVGDEELQKILWRKWETVVRKLEEEIGKLRLQTARLKDTIEEIVEVASVTDDQINNMIHGTTIREILSESEDP
jgi:hypothetical protein